MKKLHLLFISLVFGFGSLALQAQTDVTNKIVNPSFEDNVDALADGWTYEGGADTIVWHTINTDGDETKTGNNICGLWNPTFGDFAITQTINGLDNGIYKLTADMMCSRNAASSRLTTQRIFINDRSVLFGANSDTNYSADNLDILALQGEVITFANYPVSPVGKENGPFMTCEVIDTVTDGTIVIGVKTNGSDTQLGFTFPLLTGGDGWGWFKVDNFTLTYMGALGIKDNLSNNTNLKVLVKNGYITVEGVNDFNVYSVSGRLISSDEQLKPGIYIIKANNKVAKIVVSDK